MPLPLDAAHPESYIVGERGDKTGEGSVGTWGTPGGAGSDILASYP